jgi:polyribonucleotide nucleotidyltransferase
MDFDKLSESKLQLNEDDTVGMEQTLINNIIKDNKTGIEIEKEGDVYKVSRHGAPLKEYKSFEKLLEYLLSILKGEPEVKPSYDEIPEKTE